MRRPVARPHRSAGGSFVERYRSSVADMSAAQKPPRGVSLYSTKVNRPAGRRLAAAADVLGLRPNQVTVASAACSLTAVALLAGLPASVALGLVVAGLLAVGFALDSADGQLARLRRSGSPAGEFLDHMLDCLVKTTLHASVLVAGFRAGERGAALLVPLAFSTVSVLLFFGGILVTELRRHRPTARPDTPMGGRASAVGLLPADHGVLCLSFALWGLPEVFTVVYATLFAVNAALLVVQCVRWYRELS